MGVFLFLGLGLVVQSFAQTTNFVNRKMLFLVFSV
jgi:hypothetical protein